MPNLSPEAFEQFWFSRDLTSTEDWPEGYAILVHPDKYLNEIIETPTKEDSRWPEKWYLYLVLQPGQGAKVGEVRVEEDPTHCQFRVTGVSPSGAKVEQRQYYGLDPPTGPARTKHEEGTRRSAYEEERAPTGHGNL